MKKVAYIFAAVAVAVTAWLGLVDAEAANYNYLTYEIKNGEVTITGCDKSLYAVAVVPDTIEGYPVTAVAPYAFANCTRMYGVNLPESVTKLGQGAFYNTAFYNDEGNWVNGVFYVGRYLCDARKNITGVHEVLRTTTVIADSAFVGCSGLTDVIMYEGVTHIGDQAFCFCENLRSVNFPQSLVSIGDGAFSECKALQSIEMPDGLQNLGECAFYYCSSLTDVVIPRGITEIKFSVFDTCTSLSSVTVHGGVKKIHDYAFYECTSLASVYYEGYAYDWQKLSVGKNNDPLLKAYVYSRPVGTGDVNGDEKITTDDAVYLMYVVTYGESAYPVNQFCDFNKDGRVSSDDAVYLLFSVMFGNDDYPLNREYDYNGDKKVNGEDAVYVLNNILYGDSEYPMDRDCDFNGDGKETTDDALFFLNYVLGIEEYDLGVK